MGVGDPTKETLESFKDLDALDVLFIFTMIFGWIIAAIMLSAFALAFLQERDRNMVATLVSMASLGEMGPVSGEAIGANQLEMTPIAGAMPAAVDGFCALLEMEGQAVPSS